MDNKIKVSVIVPIYNVEKYLHRCITSLVSQTLQEIEIILVNDGSPDQSQAIIDEFVAAYPNKVIGLQKENGGLSDARNYGIPYAKGEYIGFLDSDDYADVTMFEKLYEEAVRSEADIVTCGYYGVDENKNTYRYFQKGNMLHFGKSLEENPKLLYINAPYAWNKIYRRTLFEKTNILFPKGLLYEDIATVYPLMMYANKIAKVDEPLVYYILKREGAITATFNDKILQMYDALRRMNDLYLDGDKFEDFKTSLGFINIKHTILRFRDFTLYNDRKLQRKMVKEGFRLLNTYFPDWRNNDVFFNFYFKKKRIMRVLSKYRFTWYMYSFIPNGLIRMSKKLGSYVKKAKKVLTKRSYINKFYYARLCKQKPLDEHAILFESFHGKALTDSPFAMMQQIAKDTSYKLYYTTTKAKKEEHATLLKEYGINATLVCLGTREYQKALACSKYLVNNVSFPTYFMRREGQLYLNTWHGTPLKTLGKKMVKGIQDMSNIQRNFLESTHLLHPNEYTMRHMMEDYNLNDLFTGEVILNGYPRNAVFLNDEKAKEIRFKCGLENKEVFIYMPTWRGAASSVLKKHSYKETVLEILQTIDEQLNDHQVMYVNLHPLVQKDVEIEGYKHILKFPADINSYEFMNIADVLITDYSSVFFDFSIKRKPVVLFMYDYDEYMEERGMYMDIRSLPFEKIYTLQDLVTYMKKEDKSIDLESPLYQAYEKEFLPYDKIESITQLNDYFFKGKDTGLHILSYAHNKDVERTLYLAPKIKHKDDIAFLEDILKLENPVVCFLRRDFTSHTLDVLNAGWNDKLTYVVSDVQMHLTLYENFLVFLSRQRHRYDVPSLYRREINRLLPNLKITNVVAGEETHRNMSIYQAINHKE